MIIFQVFIFNIFSKITPPLTTDDRKPQTFRLKIKYGLPTFHYLGEQIPFRLV